MRPSECIISAAGLLRGFSIYVRGTGGPEALPGSGSQTRVVRVQRSWCAVFVSDDDDVENVLLVRYVRLHPCTAWRWMDF